MTFKKLVMSVVSAAVLASSAVANVANAGEIEANVALSTDYIFRGFTQTNNDPAISGGFDYSFDSGFYVGVWASNVNFGSNSFLNDDGELDSTSSTSTEIDVYGGYAVEIADGVELDLGYVYFVYPGDSGALNYSEFTSTITFYEDLSFGLIYSPDYFGSDEDAIVFNTDYSFGIAKNLSLDLHAGYTTVSGDDNFFANNVDDYIDYSIGLSTSAAGVDLSLTYYDTDIDDTVGDEIGAEDRIVFSIGKSF